MPIYESGQVNLVSLEAARAGLEQALVVCSHYVGCLAFEKTKIECHFEVPRHERLSSLAILHIYMHKDVEINGVAAEVSICPWRPVLMTRQFVP